MKTSVSAFILSVTAIVIFQSCDKNDSNNPDRYFTKEQQTSLIKQTLYYSTKLPPQSTYETRFSPEFDWYYAKALEEYDLRASYPDPNGGYYFLMTRKARSIWPAREAIGARLDFDTAYKLKEYEEIFRTWKMTEDTLNQRAFELFDLMKEGKDLTPYRSKFKGDRYIEFPDDRFIFDIKSRRWKDTQLDSLRVQ